MTTPDTSARIRFCNVSVDYPTADGPMRVLDGIDYEIRQGEFVSVIGPSGCGKTTMMNIVAGFVQPTQGQVLLDGRPIAGPGPDRGVIFQEYGVFPWLTVKENIAFGLTLRANQTSRAERDEICQRYMELMGWPTSPTITPSTCRAACASGWRWRAPTPSSRSSC